MTSKNFVPVLKNIKIFHAFPKYKNIPSDKITDRTRCKYNFRFIEYLLHARLWRNGVIACEIYIHGVFIAPPDLSHFIFQLRKKRLNSFHGSTHGVFRISHLYPISTPFSVFIYPRD